MKKVMIVLLSIMTAGLFAGGYSSSYGPGDQCKPVNSTLKSFILFDSITLNGESIDNGTENTATIEFLDDDEEIPNPDYNPSDGSGQTGYCDSEDCDMLLATYFGECVGWSYLPIVNDGITFIVELAILFFLIHCMFVMRIPLAENSRFPPSRTKLSKSISSDA